MTVKSENPYKLVGDTVNIAVLAASLVYLFIAVYFTLPGAQGVVDEYWKRDGFCIQNRDVPYWSSFDTCLYVDVVGSVVIGILYWAWKDVPGMEAVSKLGPAVIAATLGHGAAHGIMATKLRDGTYFDDNESIHTTADLPLWQAILGCALFWFPLLKGVMPKVSTRYVGLGAVLAMYGMGFVKKELGFPYVQTVVNVGAHVSQLTLSKDEKNLREYMTFPLANVLPIVVAWNELLFCDSYFRSFGGHVLYDASIVVSFIVFYTECYFFGTDNKKNLMKEKAA